MSLATLQAIIIIWPRQLKMKRGRLRPAKEDHHLQDFWKNTSSNLVRKKEKRKHYSTYLHCLQCTWVCLTVSMIIIHLNVIWKQSWNKNAAFSPLPVWNWGFSNPLFLLLRTRVTTLKVGRPTTTVSKWKRNVHWGYRSTCASCSSALGLIRAWVISILRRPSRPLFYRSWPWPFSKVSSTNAVFEILCFLNFLQKTGKPRRKQMQLTRGAQNNDARILHSSYFRPELFKFFFIKMHFIRLFKLFILKNIEIDFINWKFELMRTKKNVERFTILRVILAQGPC